MPIYLVDRSFEEPVDLARFQAASAALTPCLEARDVKWIASHLSTDGRRALCIYEADDAEMVREANHSAGVPFDRVWQALRVPAP